MSSQPRNDDVRNLEEVAEEEDVVKLEEEEEEDGEMAQKIVEYRTTLTSSLLESPRPVLPTQLLNESDPKPPTLPAPDTDAAVSQVMFSSRIELEQAVAEAEEFMEDYMRRYIEDDSAYQRLRRAISKRSRRSRRAGRRNANRKEKRDDFSMTLDIMQKKMSDIEKQEAEIMMQSKRLDEYDFVMKDTSKMTDAQKKIHEEACEAILKRWKEEDPSN